MTRFLFLNRARVARWVPFGHLQKLHDPRRLSLSAVSLFLSCSLVLLSCSHDPTPPAYTAEFRPAICDFPVTALGDTARLAVELASLADWNQVATLTTSSPEFSISDGGTDAEVLVSAGRTATLEARFHPTAEGVREGEIGVEGALCVPLACRGTGKEDPCRVAPTELAFGRLDPGEERALGFTVTCDGPDSVSGSVESGGLEFGVTVGGGAFQLAPGESLNVLVTYRPLALGEHACSITLGAAWCEDVTCTGRASTTWRVVADGTGDAPTVQAGIDSASHGDVVLVGPGRYYETINLRGKRIHLLGEQGPEVTILDGSRGDDSVVVCESGETNETIIEGFTITGGKGRIRAINGRRGAGILCLDATPVIQGNIIAGNRAITPPDGNQSRGGGISYARGEGSPPLAEALVLKSNFIRDNYASYLGGGMILAGPAVVEGNVISMNEAGRDGGGAYIGGSGVTFARNRLVGNIARDHGGGIYIVNSPTQGVVPALMEIRGNLIVDNESYTTKATDCSGGGIWVSGGAWIHHNTIIFNYAESLSGPAAGGICLVRTGEGTLVEYNLVHACNDGAVVAASGFPTPYRACIRRNLLFGNGPVEIYNLDPEWWDLRLDENIFEDPLLCDDSPESDGSVAENSPALTQSWGVIGTVPAPGCGTAVHPSAGRGVWGAIRARHGP